MKNDQNKLNADLVQQHIQDQSKQFFSLYHKGSSEKSNIIKYLNFYDAYMRLATIEALKTKSQILNQESPHKDARLLVAKYDLPYDLQHLISIRHGAKKENKEVAAKDIETLYCFVNELHQILSAHVPTLVKKD